MSDTNSIVSIVVAAATFAATGSPQAAQAAYVLTSAGLSVVNPQQVQGPKLNDLKANQYEYGTPIPICYGHPRVPGIVVWSSRKREVESTSGGKGGPEVTNYTYEQDVLYMLTGNEYAGVRRIWSNGKLIWTAADDATEESILASQETDAWTSIEFFTGSSTQMPWSVYEAAKGVGNVPAYRGRLTVGITGLNLGSSGYPPNLTFEVIKSGTGLDPEIFEYTGSVQTWTCPANVTSVLVTAWGGGGAGSAFYNQPGSEAVGGAAGYTAAIINVTPGETYDVVVGQGGRIDGLNAFGGGGAGSVFGTTTLGRIAGGGGGRSALRTQGMSAADIVVAAGGGGAGASRDNGACEGGAGGGDVGIAGGDPAGGGGGTQAAGGAGGIASGAFADNGGNGNLEEGADGGGGSNGDGGGGGGGGGYYGGGGGGGSNEQGGGGGGGSGFPAGSSTAGSGRTPAGSSSSFYDGNGVGGNVREAGTNGRVIIGQAGVFGLACEPLDEVVTDLCERAGLDSSYLDVTDLESDSVCAMAITQVTPARQVIETLMTAYNFTAVEGETLKFVKRGGPVAMSPPYIDLGASDGDPPEDRLPIAKRSDIEVPAQISVTYSNLDNDYQNATEYSDRIVTGSTGVANIQLPLGLEPSQARQIAAIRLLDSAVASTSIGPIGLSKFYCQLEPTDIVLLTDISGSTFRTRVERVTDTISSRSIELALDDASAVESSIDSDEDYETSTIVQAIEPTDLELMDIPILRDADNEAGLYGVAAPESTAGVWPGARLYRGIDPSYSALLDFTTPGTFGTTTTALGDVANPWVDDNTNTVTVSVNGTLSSYSDDAILNGTADGYLIGSEVIYAKTASLVSPGVYTLSGLFRGRRGTEWATGLHTSSDRVVLLSTTIRRVPMDNGQIGVSFDYKPVTFGRTVAGTTEEAFTNTAIGLKPFAPVHLEADDNGDGTFDVTWQRRTRLDCRFGGSMGINVPLGEATELYRVTVYDGSTEVSSTTVTTESATVTASAGYRVTVAQISAIVSDGYEAEITL